jgi:hypothetical protein
MSTVSFHAGTAEDKLLGPYFLPPRLTGAVYHDLLLIVLPELLQEVHLWFMHDGASPHFFLQFGNF